MPAGRFVASQDHGHRHLVNWCADTGRSGSTGPHRCPPRTARQAGSVLRCETVPGASAPSNNCPSSDIVGPQFSAHAHEPVHRHQISTTPARVAEKGADMPRPRRRNKAAAQTWFTGVRKEKEPFQRLGPGLRTDPDQTTRD